MLYSPFPPMLKSAHQHCFILLVALLWNNLLTAQQTDSSAAQFVQEILARAGSPSAVTLNFDNLSSLPAADQEALKRSFTAGPRSAGFRFAKSQLSVGAIQITLSSALR